MADSVTVRPEAFLVMGREVLAKQPFSILIGAELVALSPGRCELHVPVTDAVCRCDVFVLQDGVEKLCAVAQGTIAALPTKNS